MRKLHRNLETMLVKHLLINRDTRKPCVSQGMKTYLWSLVASNPPDVIAKFCLYQFRHSLRELDKKTQLHVTLSIMHDQHKGY